jgi:hypothetical protein
LSIILNIVANGRAARVRRRIGMSALTSAAPRPESRGQAQNPA